MQVRIFLLLAIWCVSLTLPIAKIEPKGKDLVGELTKAIRRLKPGVDPYIVQAIVWTLSEERGSLAVKWLAGEQLEAQDAADLRLPPNNKTEEEVNAFAPTMIAKLLSLLGEYKSVVVCFDELDTIAADTNGFTPVFVIFDLVKRLFDSVSQSKEAKGLVTLTVVLPDLWRQIEQAKFASSEKISAHGKPIDLELLNSETIKELAALTLNRFYSKKRLVPPHELFPFVKEDLTAFGKGRPTPRESLKWLASKLNETLAGHVKPVSPSERLERAYQNALTQFDSDDLDSNDQVAAALRFGFEKIIEIDRLREQPIEGVVLRKVEDITPRAKNNGRLNFKIAVEEGGEAVVIGIGVLQESHGLSVGAGFRRLLDLDTFRLSRGCLVRSRDRKIKRNWDSFEYYQQLVAAGGEWVDLKVDEIKPLFALQYVYEHHEKFDLTIKRLDSFAFVRNLLRQSLLIKEILSRPEGIVVEEALEGDELQRLSDSDDLSTLEDDLAMDLSSSDANETADAQSQADLQEFAEALAV